MSTAVLVLPRSSSRAGASSADRSTTTSSTTVVVTLRYRPLGDVLSLEVAAPSRVVDSHTRECSDADIIENVADPVDADLRLTWAVLGDGRRRLAGLDAVHASRLVRSRLPVVIEPALAAAMVDLVDRGLRAARAADSISARARLLVTSDVAVDVDHLVRSDAGETRPPSPTPGRTRLRRAVMDVAAAVRSSASLHASTDPVAASGIVSALGELADALARHRGAPAPGSAAVARSRVVGAVGLTTAERIELRDLLDRLAAADTEGWPQLADRARALGDAIAPWSTRPRSTT